MPECCDKYADAVFVFGANEASRYGKGAALHARLFHGAVSGSPNGWQPGCRSYALPTKDAKLRPLPLAAIRAYVSRFLASADANSHERFYVTAVGCGLAGYRHEDIAPMFADAPLNCILPKEWVQWTRPNQKG